MGGDENLYPLPLQFKQDFDQRSEQPGIQVGLGPVPEQDRPLEQGAILNQQPQQAEFAETLGEQRELQNALPVPEKKFIVAGRHIAFQNFSQLSEQPSARYLRGTKQRRKKSPIEDVRIYLLEMNTAPGIR